MWTQETLPYIQGISSSHTFWQRYRESIVQQHKEKAWKESDSAIRELPPGIIYVWYLLLHTHHPKTVVILSFCGAGIQESLSWALLSVVTLPARSVIWKLTGAGASASVVVHSWLQIGPGRQGALGPHLEPLPRQLGWPQTPELPINKIDVSTERNRNIKGNHEQKRCSYLSKI